MKDTKPKEGQTNLEQMIASNHQPEFDVGSSEHVPSSLVEDFELLQQSPPPNDETKGKIVTLEVEGGVNPDATTKPDLEPHPIEDPLVEVAHSIVDDGDYQLHTMLQPSIKVIPHTPLSGGGGAHT